MERKCVEPTVVQKSEGKAVCHPRFKVRYLDNGEYGECPKVKGILPPRIPLSTADSVAWGVRKRLGYS